MDILLHLKRSSTFSSDKCRTGEGPTWECSCWNTAGCTFNRLLISDLLWMEQRRSQIRKSRFRFFGFQIQRTFLKKDSPDQNPDLDLHKERGIRFKIENPFLYTPLVFTWRHKILTFKSKETFPILASSRKRHFRSVSACMFSAR